MQALWPAVGEAVAENGMLGAALRRPARSPRRERLTVAFPEDAAFVRKKARPTALVQRALGGLGGRRLAIVYELRGDVAADTAATLADEELIERLRAEFAAEEIFDDEEKTDRHAQAAEPQSDDEAGPADAG